MIYISPLIENNLKIIRTEIVKKFKNILKYDRFIDNILLITIDIKSY